MLRIQLPTRGIVLLASLHVLWAGLFGLLNGQGFVLMAWQLFAWPTLVCISLVTMSPVIDLIRSRWTPPWRRTSLWITGLSLSLATTVSLVWGSRRGELWLGVVPWLFGLCGALMLESALPPRVGVAASASAAEGKV